MNSENLKLAVKEKYGKIASQSKLLAQNSCCADTACCNDSDYSVFNDSYAGMVGYLPDADLSLGCGLPTEFAEIRKGDSVLDLGSGAGNDCFVASKLTGNSGKVTGMDFSKEMLSKAQRNLEKSGFNNIDFVHGDIEDMPFPDNSYNVIISNCVLNLVPDKQKAFSEIYRVLKPEGHFCISDVILTGELPAGLQQEVEMYAGCVSGAIQKESYLEIIQQQGFFDIKIQKEKPIVLPNELLLKYISLQELEEFIKSGAGIYSITVTANK